MTCEYTLKSGATLTVDDCDADLLEHPWYEQKRAKPYVFTTGHFNGKRGSQFVHRLIMARVVGRDLTRGEEIDHINGDKRDNRRGNLRFATRSQNMANSGIRSDNVSGFKGVHWSTSSRKWAAAIHHQGQRIHLGMFLSREEAHDAYLAKARELNGAFAPGEVPTVADDIPDGPQAVETVYPFEAIAREHGLSIPDFLVSKLNEHRTIQATADALGFHYQSIFRWIKRLHISRGAPYAKSGVWQTRAATDPAPVKTGVSEPLAASAPRRPSPERHEHHSTTQEAQRHARKTA